MTITIPGPVNTTLKVLATARLNVRDQLRHLDLNVHLYLPDDVTQVPCVVIGRPSIEDGVSIVAADFLVSVPVMVLGRPVRDDDAQQQLDQVADLVIDRLVQVQPISVTPETESVAGLTYPAYLITVSVPYRLC